MSRHDRTSELRLNLAEVRQRVDAACIAAHRKPEDVSIIVVTKTWPVEDIKILADLDVVDIGESRDQEAGEKFSQCTGLDLRWHFIGQFQTNKAGRIARYADVVHSIDRLKAVEALAAAAQRADRQITALVQVSLEISVAEGRGGAAPEEVLSIAAAIDAATHLTLGGVMAVAPLGADADEAFERLQKVADRVQANFPGATMISAGMSDDMVQAVAHGATHLRIGSAIMGSRSYVE